MTHWQTILQAAEGPSLALAEAMARPVEAQDRLLRNILSGNAASDFGKAHGFKSIRSIEDYRRRVPIRTYDDFHPFIDRIAAGEADVLTGDAVIALEETGGASGGRKLIPYTQAGLLAFRAAILPWLRDLCARRPSIMQGSAYVTISPALRTVAFSPGGLRIGLESDAAYLGDELAGAFLGLLAVGPVVQQATSVDEWRLMTLSGLIDRPDLSFVSIWSPTLFLDLLLSVPRLAEALSHRLQSSSAKARLRAALATGTLDATVLWPGLDTISCWADASSRPFAQELAALCPQASLQPKGLLSTESAITIPIGDEDGAVPALTSAFLEFITDGGEVRSVHELTKDECYRVVITTPSGLYRYDTSDIVSCVSISAGVPRLRFEGRGQLTSDMVGEKLTDVFAGRALANLPAPGMLVARAGPGSPCYELWIDGETLDVTWGETIDAALRANPQYDYARKIGQLGPLVLMRKPGYAARHAELMAQRGFRLGDVKPVFLRCAAATSAFKI